MEVGSRGSSQLLKQSKIGSRYFLAYTVLTGINAALGLVMLLKFLSHLSFGAASSLSAGTALCVSLWYFAARGRERILFRLNQQSNGPDESLSIAMDVFEKGLLLTGFVIFILMGAIVQVLAVG